MKFKNIKIGRHYRVVFSEKDILDNACGLPPYVYLMIDWKLIQAVDKKRISVSIWKERIYFKISETEHPYWIEPQYLQCRYKMIKLNEFK